MYLSSDVYLVAALVVLELPFDEYQEDNGRLTFLWQKDVIKVREVADSYYCGSLMIPAAAYSSQIKLLKTLCHASPRNAPVPHTSSSPLDRLLNLGKR